MSADKSVVTLDIVAQVNGLQKVIGLTGNLEQLRNVFNEVCRSSGALKLNFEKSLAQFSQMTVAIQNMGNLLGQLTSQYTSFESAMRMANTMAHKDAAGFEHMTDEIKELSKRIPMAGEQLAAGLYATISNGVEQCTMQNLLSDSDIFRFMYCF